MRQAPDQPIPQKARHSGWRWLPLTATIIALDQVTKAAVIAQFAYAENSVVLPVLSLTLRYNLGAAFNFLADASGWQRWFFSLLAVVAATAIFVWLRILDGRTRARFAIGLSLIQAGAVGNLIDRLRLGHVVDFIHVHWSAADFPAFNVADSAITVGAILMLLDGLRKSRE